MAAVTALYSKSSGAADNSLGFLSEKQLAKLARSHARNAARRSETALWVDNVRSYQLFERFRTQMISVGMGGVVGLNYIPLQHYLDKTAKDDEDWEDLFSDFQACESAMVDAISKMNK